MRVCVSVCMCVCECWKRKRINIVSDGIGTCSTVHRILYYSLTVSPVVLYHDVKYARSQFVPTFRSEGNITIIIIRIRIIRSARP